MIGHLVKRALAEKERRRLYGEVRVDRRGRAHNRRGRFVVGDFDTFCANQIKRIAGQLASEPRFTTGASLGIALRGRETPSEAFLSPDAYTCEVRR